MTWTSSSAVLWNHGIVLTPTRGSPSFFRRAGVYLEVLDVGKEVRVSATSETQFRTYMWATVSEDRKSLSFRLISYARDDC